MENNSGAVRGGLQRVHMIGIGGAGMSGIARILLARGSVVSGSDMKDSRSLMALKASGAQVAIGHAEDNLMLSGVLPTVVVTSFAAIPQDNPELSKARELGIPIMRRSDVLALLMENNRSFLLAGTHGKTSTTSMAVVAAQTAGMDPSFAIGGQLNKAGTNAHQGSGDIFIAEADESDGSFLSYSPTVAVITNIEPDHLDYFGTPEAYYEVFEQFIGCVVPDGAIVLCIDDPGTVQLAQKILAGQVECAAGVHIYGYGTEAAVKAHPDIPCAATITAIHTNPRGGSTARVEFSAELYPEHEPLSIDVAIPGEHMVLNAVAACIGGIFLGASPVDFAEGISQFDGVRRRFEQHIRLNSGPLEGVSVYDDYAHHPTEVSAVLRAASALVQQQGQGRVLAIFQPHLYSRTINFATEFAEALSLADRVYVLDIFGAREDPVEGVDSRILTDKITVPALYLPDFSSVADTVVAELEPYDVVLTIGAGTVTMIAPEIVRILMERY